MGEITNVTHKKRGMKEITLETMKETAKRLHSELAEFNRIIRLLSRNQTHGIGGENYHQSIITCDDEGRLHLDFKPLRYCDFKNVSERLANKDIYIPEPKIWDENR